MIAIRHALVAALAVGALLPPPSAVAQTNRGVRVESRRDAGRNRCDARRDGGWDIIFGRDDDRRRDRRVDRRDRDRRRDCRVRDDRRDRRRDGARDRDRGRRVRRGPSFCRSGAGHPVYGRRWCRDKGFTLGHDRLDGRRDRRIDRRGDRRRDRRIDRPIYRLPDVRYRRGRIDRGGLLDILGDLTYGRLDGHRSRHGIRDAPYGRWYRDSYGRHALLITAGGVHIADLVDRGYGYELVLRPY
ncbi:MAG: hypothetical protein ABFS34_10030 [Gemmatimonadota bacterium]